MMSFAIIAKESRFVRKFWDKFKKSVDNVEKSYNYSDVRAYCNMGNVKTKKPFRDMLG
jgi:hypothetical protein